MPLSQRYRRNPEFVFRQIADEMILVPIKQKVGDLGCLYSLNATAGRIWDLLDGTEDLAAIRDALASEFDIGEEDLTEHLLTFVEQLKEIEAVTEVTPQAATGREAVNPP
ncbi:PqqD family protein [Nitrospinae bacterium AH-259-F20]|nr:PqqD family protein [Nitrospinae bacterium AH-259-F20]